MAKRGQSKYMPHLRNQVASARVVGRSEGWDKVAAALKATGVKEEMLHVNERGVTRTLAEMQTKGRFGGLCNRSACLRHEAYWWNRGSRAYYCQDCAHLINSEFRHRDDVENYGSLLLMCPDDVTVVDLSSTAVGHEKPWAIQFSNDSLKYADSEEEALKLQRHYRHVVGLRSDGSAPLWFKELSERYEKLRGMVTIRNSW